MPWNDYLTELRNSPVHVVAHEAGDGNGTAGVVLHFSNGTTLDAFYWRLIAEGAVAFSSFDHNQRYGNARDFDAKKSLIERLNGTQCRCLELDEETADLEVSFSSDMKLQVFSFTAYEIWRIRFPDGVEGYSNHILR